MHSRLSLCVLYVLFRLITDGSCSQDQCRTLVFSSAEEFNGKRLINHVINVADVLEEGSCRTLCYIEPNCVSFNFKMAASPTGHHKCELNNSTHEGHENELEKNPIYVYHGSESACVNNPCKNNGTCQSGFTDRGYRCLCTARFTGHNCQKDTDECATGTHNCSADAMCINIIGSYKCACSPGYSGDGQVCTDTDECATGTHSCSADTMCINTEGSYNCMCNPGYSGDGRACADTDECATGTHSCSADAMCINTEGSYNCTCNPGYNGDGRVCTVPYETIGCFQDTRIRAIATLEGKDPILDGGYGQRQDAIKKCYQAAKTRGFHIFAVQAGGWCASSATAVQTFDKYGNSTACASDGEGGRWANQVYVIKGYKSVGCYKDDHNRAITIVEGTDPILDRPYGSRKNPIVKCAVASLRKGYTMFAVQNGGHCQTSATAPQTFDKYGKSTACRPDGQGGSWANHVYSFQ